MNKVLTVLAIAALFSSCAHHRDVRPGASGLHRVVLQTDNEDEAERQAIAQANHYCEQQGKTAGFVDEKKSYTGDMDEQTYKTTRRAGTVAKVVGGTAHAFGGKKESSAGAILGLGGVAAHAVAGKGYTVEMSFRCI